MELDEIRLLHDRHPAWRLLRARNAPLVLGFLGRVFVEGNSGAVGEAALVERLEDYLDAAKEGRPDDQRYLGRAAGYLDDWSALDAGWLRRFYPDDVDEVHFDATSNFERAYGWVTSLPARASVGTESRLHALVELLRAMVHGADADPESRLAELHRRRQDIDDEIVTVEAGQFAVMDGAALRERYSFFASTARELLADFRGVEENFRGLDRAARERIATFEGGKGELLESVLGDREGIAGSDQGRSFQAFYDFLLSPERQSELSALLARVQSLEQVQPDPRVRRVHHDWFDAAERTQATVRGLSEQLRRYLDDQVFLENRRILELVRTIESSALAVRASPPAHGLQLDEAQLPITLPFERPLYEVRPPGDVDSTVVAASDELDTSALYEQRFVDSARLAAQIRSVVPARSSALLRDILELYPLSDGLAELVGYLALDDEGLRIELDEGSRVALDFDDPAFGRRTVRMPEVTVVRA